jgi:hypothetical protein
MLLSKQQLMAKVHPFYVTSHLSGWLTADVAVVFNSCLNRVTGLSSVHLMPGKYRPAGVSGRATTFKFGEHLCCCGWKHLGLLAGWLLLCGYLPVVLF